MVADQGVDLHLHFGRHGGQLHDLENHERQADGGGDSSSSSSDQPTDDDGKEHYHADGLHLHLVDEQTACQDQLSGLGRVLAWLTLR